MFTFRFSKVSFAINKLNVDQLNKIKTKLRSFGITKHGEHNVTCVQTYGLKYISDGTFLRIKYLCTEYYIENTQLFLSEWMVTKEFDYKLGLNYPRLIDNLLRLELQN